MRDLQNDFAARADWCVNDYKNANHAPVVKIKGDLDISAKPGQTIKLSASATDPDGDQVSYSWWEYKEAGSSNGDVVITGAESKEVSVVVPIRCREG